MKAISTSVSCSGPSSRAGAGTSIAGLAFACLLVSAFMPPALCVTALAAPTPAPQQQPAAAAPDPARAPNAPQTLAAPQTLDDCDSLDGWRVIPADGVEASLSRVPGVSGAALCLDFNFARGSGFVVVRRALDLPLPENYRFWFNLRGEGPPNNFEFKLVDGDNVWWVNRRAFELPASWQRIAYKRRHLQFAWGPSGGTPLTKLNAIEFAIASAAGGRGRICFDELQFEPLPPPQSGPYQLQLVVPESGGPRTLTPDADGRVAVETGTSKQPRFQILLNGSREFGGLALDWPANAHPNDYDVSTSTDGQNWQPAASVVSSNGGTDWIRLPDAEAAFIRIEFARSSLLGNWGLNRVRVLPTAFGEWCNRVFE